MAECVSCGKSIAEGELFCRECLARMKGRGPRLEDGGGSAGGLSGFRGDASKAVTPRDRREKVEDRVLPVVENGSGFARKARGELTPAREKKVVSLRPRTEDRRRAEKGAFRITITLSERGYRLLARLGLGTKTGEKKKGQKKGGKVTYLRPVPGGASGRVVSPAAKNVDKKGKSGLIGGLIKYISPRKRDWDRADWTSALFILASSFISLALFPLNWIKVEWLNAGETTPQAVGVKGYQLGIWSYLILGLVLIGLLYLLLWFLLGRPPLPLDFGALSLVVGFLGIAFFNLCVSSNSRILRVAAAGAGLDPLSLSGPQAGLSRYTQIPAYMVLLCLIVIPLAGLARLSRKD